MFDCFVVLFLVISGSICGVNYQGNHDSIESEKLFTTELVSTESTGLCLLTKRIGQVSHSGLQRGKSTDALDVFDSQISQGDEVLALTSPSSPSPGPSPLPTVSTNFLKGIIAQSIQHLPRENQDRLKVFGAAAYGMGDDETSVSNSADRSKLSVTTLCSGTDGVIDTLKDRVPAKHPKHTEVIV